MILKLPSGTATPGDTQGSIRAELLHREHRLSPPRSPDDLGQAEKFRNEVQRSAARSRHLAERRLVGTPQTNVSTFETTVTEGIGGAIGGTYLMVISLGTPPQDFVALADIGSSLVWLQCAPCIGCYNQLSPLFYPSLSSSYDQLSCSSRGCQTYISDPQNKLINVTACNSSATCPYDYAYGRGYTQGNYSANSITLRSTIGGNVTIPNFLFGCSQNTSVAQAPADGLVGMGQGIISLPTQLGHVFEDKFSFCLVSGSYATVKSSLLVFGQDAGSGPISEKLQYTPILNNLHYPNYYYVALEGISVDGVPLNFSAADVAFDSDGYGGTIFNAGAVISALDDIPYYQLLAAIVPRVSKSYTTITDPLGLELCYNITGHPDYATEFPSISFKFANATSWDFAFENSWIHGNGSTVIDPSAVCLAFARIPSSRFSIFGTILQEDFYMLFDRVNHRIAFAATDCASMAA